MAALKEKGIAAEFLSSTQKSSVKNKVKYGAFNMLLLFLYLPILCVKGFPQKFLIFVSNIKNI